MNAVNNSYNDERPSPDHMEKCLEARMEQLVKEDICLAFSGGVDLSLFLEIAAGAVVYTGRNVYTVMFDSRLHPSCDPEIARYVTGRPGGIHEVVIAGELGREAIKNNPASRYYLCKRRLLSKLAELAQIRGVRYIPDGTNEGDMHVCRSGIQALEKLGITNPLAELRITKAQVEALISEYEILVVSCPPTPCMAACLPHDTALDYEVSGRIGAGEAYVRTMVPGNVCLRLHRDITRLELDPEVLDIFMKCRKGIISCLEEMGSVYITLDIEGFRFRSVDVGLTGLS